MPEQMDPTSAQAAEGERELSAVELMVAQRQSLRGINALTAEDLLQEGLYRAFLADSERRRRRQAAILEHDLIKASGDLLIERWVLTHAPLDQIREVEKLATDVIGSNEDAVKWLSEANPATDGRAPLDLLGDQEGYDRVKNLLMRIEYGVLA